MEIKPIHNPFPKGRETFGSPFGVRGLSLFHD